MSESGPNDRSSPVLHRRCTMSEPEVPLNRSDQELDHPAEGLDPLITKRYHKTQQTTAVYADGQLLGLEKGNTQAQNYGVVVDIGTVTLEAGLVEIHSGQEIASVAALNPQSRMAEDVLSRTKLATEQNRLLMVYF